MWWSKNDYLISVSYIFFVGLGAYLSYSHFFLGVNENIYTTQTDYEEQRAFGSFIIAWWFGLYFSTFKILELRKVCFILSLYVIYLVLVSLDVLPLFYLYKSDGHLLVDFIIWIFVGLFFLSPIYCHKIIYWAFSKF